MSLRMSLAWLPLAALLLAGCENDAASWQAGGEEGSALTLIREQRWFWQPRAQVALVVARTPDCQRRHVLNPRPKDDARTELYQTGPRGFLLDNGGVWYAADSGQCGVQRVEAPAPAAVGKRLGAFDRKGGRLVFTP